LIDANDKDVLIIEGPKFIELTGGVVCKRCRVFEASAPKRKGIIGVCKQTEEEI
jgi:hypothetical protein